MTSRNGFVFPEFEMPDWPEAWRFFHGKSGDRIGLGPFSLPFDWPEFDLPAFLVDPLGTIKIHIGELFSGTSNSGEPFAFTALRWLQGLSVVHCLTYAFQILVGEEIARRKIVMEIG